MLSMLRTGPRIILVETAFKNELRVYLEENLSAQRVDHAMALEQSEEGWTIVMRVERFAETVDFDDVRETYLIKEESDTVLCHLISSHELPSDLVCRTSARILVIRALGNLEAAFQSLKEDFSGQEASFLDNMKNHNHKGTVVVLTSKPLSHRTGLNDMFEKTLYIEMPFADLYRKLRVNALKYLNAGLENKDWYEIELRIYDRYSAYGLHYERLMQMIDLLEVGMVLGESWGKDHPRPFMEVEVYRLRLFSFMDGKQIKRLLMGLEFLSDGTRIVDYDVYFNRKRVGWTDAITKEERRTPRHILAMETRIQLFEKLSEADQMAIKVLEEEILKTRND